MRVASLALVAGLLPTPAWAFTFETSVSHGCHERVTLDALERVGWPGGARPPLLDGENGLRVERDLPFSLRPSARDVWSIAPVLGARDNDLHGRAADEVAALAVVHSDPEGQAEHCLRRPQDDGPDGDRAALDACRRFILDEVALAVGAEPAVDLDAREPHTVALAFSGRQRPALQPYGWHMGRALHALQDSFTHTFRSPDGARVRHVLNFADWTEHDDHDPARDGHRHLSELDDCAAETSAARARTRNATAASVELLRAVVDDLGGAAGRSARAAAVLDRWLAYEPGCAAENRWCDAAELDEASEGCSVSRVGATTGAFPWALAVVALALVGRRRRALVLGAALALLPTSALAQRRQDVPARRWGLHALASASLDQGAFAVTLGGHWRASSRVTVGLSAEYNPWFSLVAGRVQAGVVNLYATGAYTWRQFEGLRLQTSVHLGASVLLLDLVGADAGSVGPFVGGNILGLSVELSDRLRLVVEPASVCVPVPHLRGVPLLYPQYRFTIGLEWDP